MHKLGCWVGLPAGEELRQIAMKMNDLKEASVTGKRSAKRAAVRFGRPPKKLAGEVEERILDAARKVFLERGFAAASIDEIAEIARSGKPTIYARFPGKEALFTAVVMRSVAANVARFDSYTPTGANIEERLESVAVTVLEWILLSDSIGLMRVAIAEAPRFPDLASSVFAMARERGGQAVGPLLAEAAQSDEFGALAAAFAPEHVTTTTHLFQDLVILPLVIRALFGEKLKQLRAEIGPHATRSIAIFLAACRHGGVGRQDRALSACDDSA
jgi:AcrR family transcriptional regulator